MRLVLASASPRRKELLEQLGLECEICPANIDETVLSGETPLDYVKRLALEKAKAATSFFSGAEAPLGSTYVLGSDTSVVLGQRVFGKPRDEDDFIEMMQALSGKTHQVITAYAVYYRAEKAASWCSAVEVAVTDVSFKTLSDEEIRWYWQSEEPRDKAGGYGIQGKGAVFVENIAGSYSNVVGLPLFELTQMLCALGYDVFGQAGVDERGSPE